MDVLKRDPNDICRLLDRFVSYLADQGRACWLESAYPSRFLPPDSAISRGDPSGSWNAFRTIDRGSAAACCWPCSRPCVLSCGRGRQPPWTYPVHRPFWAAVHTTAEDPFVQTDRRLSPTSLIAVWRWPCWPVPTPQGQDDHSLDHDAGRHHRRQGSALWKPGVAPVLLVRAGLPPARADDRWRRRWPVPLAKPPAWKSSGWASTGLPCSLLMLMALLPPGQEVEKAREVVDFVSSLFVFLLLALVILGVIADHVAAGQPTTRQCCRPCWSRV